VKIIPNLLSAARLALAPYLFLLLWRRQYGLALAVCFIAGVTDAFDGVLARRWKASSKIGAYLDPIGDKVLLSGAFLTLALDGAIEKWVAILVLGRDVLILAMAASAFLFTKIRSFPPSWWGKASTTAQICYVLALLLHFVGFFPLALVELGKWIAVALAIWSGAHYIWIAIKVLRGQPRLRGPG
jgi:cardiolipin synthase (CMP-forming)